ELEQVLTADFQVPPAAIGAALSKFFGVPYEPFRPERLRPTELLRNLKRDYVEASQWLPLEETQEGVVVIACDPERIRSSRMANNVFPKRRIVYRVSKRHEFEQLVGQFFAPA
ncbi:MAG TPA: secretion system protein E, partial [Candidatus Accumulibacter sp.]|nr:secretion system protein E [Accumulibacter sp.]